MNSHPTTTAAPVPRYEPSEDPAVIALFPEVTAAIRAQNLSRVEKANRAWSLIDHNQIRGDHIREPGETDDQFRAKLTAARHRKWAEYHVLTKLAPEGELTPHRRGHLLDDFRARCLPRARELHAAVVQVEDVEQDMSELEGDSPTMKRLRDRYRRALWEASDSLSEAMDDEQCALVRELMHHRGLYRARFRLERTGRDYGTLQIFEVPLTLGGCGLRHAFRDLVRHCKTLTEVKALLGCWRIDFRAERRDGGTYLVMDGWEVWPV